MKTPLNCILKWYNSRNHIIWPNIPIGYKLNYTFSEQQIGKTKVVLHVMSADLFGIPVRERVIEDLEITGKFEDYTTKYEYELKPRVE